MDLATKIPQNQKDGGFFTLHSWPKMKLTLCGMKILKTQKNNSFLAPTIPQIKITSRGDVRKTTNRWI
jgi:hypothetical protein